ncbi:MAG: UDP-N-acetylmuramate dehydrogenase [Bacteroidales bacterium]|nr:UDP-N-acetylmuramate dehydrogenase [Bacteroidales bacterium]
MITRHEAYDLSQRNTFGMRVSCRLYVEVTEPEDLLTLDLESLPQPLFVMGGGSNLLFTGDFPGTVLHLANQGHTVLPGPEADASGLLVRVAAGVVFDDFCAWAAQEGLWGPENLSLIPGEVGASAVQNIGAYGVEAKDIIETVHAFDLQDRRFVDIPGADCGYGYRTSLFKTAWKGRYIITAVTFHLSTVPQPKLDYGGVRKALEARWREEGIGSETLRSQSDLRPSHKWAPPSNVPRVAQVSDPIPSSLSPQMIRDTIIGIRRTKLPDPEEVGSAGSFFCNPVISREHFERIVAIAKEENGPDYEVPHYEVGDQVKVPAAWMIDQCGFKGMRLGGAQVYPKQPLVIVNASGDATPDEIVALERRVIDTIKDKYGIELHPEVEHV